MQLLLAANDAVTLKSRNETVSLKDTVVINNYTIPGRGEYDIAGIQCEVSSLDKALAYFIRLEDLQVTFLSALDAGVSKLDDASNCNVLIVDVRSDDNPDTLKSILKSVEPSYLSLMGAGNTELFRQALGLPLQQSNNFKITRTGLPLEGTILVHA